MNGNHAVVTEAPAESIATQGWAPEVRSLYREHRRQQWRELLPGSISRDMNEASSIYAVVVRFERDENSPELVLHSVTVHSELLRKVLHRAFDGYDGIDTKLKDLTFYAPLHEFYYRWHIFKRCYAEEKDEDSKQHFRRLYSVIGKEILPHIDKMQDFTANGVISFEYLWAIFPPGLDVYSREDDQDRLYRVESSEYVGAGMGNQYFVISCEYVDCNGKEFGYVSTSLAIDSFSGVKKISDLSAFPAHLHPETEALLEKLNSRGEHFERLNGFNHLSYSGFYIDKGDKNDRKRYAEKTRIIVDSETFTLYSGRRSRELSHLEANCDRAEEPDGERDPPEGLTDVFCKATFQAFMRFEEIMHRHEEKRLKDLSHQTQTLTVRQRLLTNPRVQGFCLSSKIWSEFYVDNIQPIVWNEEAFRRLVLPGDYKEIIYAFVQEQLRGGDSFDDIVEGKGQGFIMLLSGVPGVGKTLTTEAVAEEMKKPLYYMSAGELGEDASSVEEALQAVLELNSKWGSILLLDECDIFLEARTTADLRRNRLVSIFLKQLEYFRGVMFLTTNRVSDFDAAFESRIHLAIDYPSLSLESRLHVWKTFLGLQGDSTRYASKLKEEHLEILAKYDLNGRQIKNIVKTARLLAKQQRAPLSMEHIEKVLAVQRKGSVFQC
ncbi:P-loop containing nucleoside triphosphate hydrolase protein [Nemania abortiva]|nr:P-loop containing nucleoside triphosphate hydrolase protein [Nemania abortiva]